jgi:DNA-directed RNA polymerase subunit RPC12/RpoP
MNTLYVIVGIGVMAMLAAGVLYRLRRPRPSKEQPQGLSEHWHPLQEEPRYTYRCPNCGRKLQYKASRAGQRAVCPICNGRFTFPAPITS